MLNQDTVKVNTLQQIISNKIQKRFYKDKDFIKKATVDLKKNYIPNDLFIEVEYLVKSRYANNWTDYFNDVQQYFDVMTLEQFTIADADRKDLKTLTNHYMSSGRSANLKKMQIIHHCAVMLKLIGFDKSHYVSKSQILNYKQTVQKQQNFIKSQSLINKDGFVIKLSKATKTKEQYVAEKINIVRTMELFAVDNGFTWSFITLTLDGDFHPNPQFKSKDWAYNGVSPADSAKLLAKDWNAIRTALKRNGLTPGVHYFGSATSEAHTDGVRHIHLLMFHHIDDLQAIRKSFFSVKSNLEKLTLDAEAKLKTLKKLLAIGEIDIEIYKQKSKKIRNPWQLCDMSKIADKTKLGAVNYVFKYIMKSVNNFDEDFDIFAKQDDLTTETIKNCAFRNALGIRGVSFFGFDNCLSKFRFLGRNLKKMKDEKAINYRLMEIIENNDLYSFIKERHHKLIANKYIEKNGNKRMVGITINNRDYLKNIFVMAKSKNIDNAKFIFIELANLVYDEIDNLVNHNYSSKSKIKDEKPPHTGFDLKLCLDLF